MAKRFPFQLRHRIWIQHTHEPQLFAERGDLQSWDDQDGWDAGDVAYVVGAAAGFAIGATAGVVVSGVLIAPIGTSCVIAMGAGVTSGLYGGWGAETAFRALMNHTMAKDIGPNTLSKLGYTVTVSGSGGVGLAKK